MAPFIPQGLVSPELNFFFALVLGIAFGYVLEQAGFSSSRKLAGVFFGYDFVVLKVFFTAAITAMTGLLFMSYLGWIDMSLVFINPTFLWSAVVGGVIMGFGFIMGGFCPGTSITGAVIGKIDAMVFVAGLFLGVFIFGHFYNTFEPLYTGSFLGDIFVYDVFGMSATGFGLLLAIVALIAFTVTQMIEDKINRIPALQIKQRPSFRFPAFLLLASLFLLFVLPSQKPGHAGETSPEIMIEELNNGVAFADSQKVLFHVLNQTSDMILIDTRSQQEYGRFSLPMAVHIPAGDILNTGWHSFFKTDPREKVFFSNGSTAATQAWTLARRAGHDHVYILEGGLNALFDMLFVQEIPEPDDLQKMEERFHARFIKKAREYFQEGMAGSSEKPVTNTPVLPAYDRPAPVAGGC